MSFEGFTPAQREALRAVSRNGGDPTGATATPYSEIKAEPVRWLWTDRVPLGMLTMFVGDPGLGKSMLTLDLAARLSRAGGATLLLTAEDSPVIVRARLDAADADPDLVFNTQLRRDGVDEGLTLPDDIRVLADLARDKRARLVVIDPLVAHLAGGVNSWRDQSIRTALAPLYRMATELHCAVLFVLHINKAQGVDPLHRTGGSIGIPGAVRSALLFARDPDDPEAERGTRRVLAHFKSNVSPLAPSLSYEIEPVEHETGQTARLRSLGESGHSGHALLAAPADPEHRSAMDEAVDVLRVELADGDQSAREVMATVRNVAGVSERTVKEAKKQLGVEAERVGGVAGGGHWVWRLAKGAGPKGVGPISEVCTLSANPHANAESEGSETLRGHSQRDNPLRRSGSCECRRPARSPRADGPDFCRTCLRSIGEAS